MPVGNKDSTKEQVLKDFDLDERFEKDLYEKTTRRTHFFTHARVLPCRFDQRRIRNRQLYRMVNDRRRFVG